MNLSVYLPEALQSRFESYTKSKGITRNAAIRNAIELLLSQEKKVTWDDWIDQIKPNEDFEPFESYRSELTPPREDIF